jgi:AcrR family transcriptional regulator
MMSRVPAKSVPRPAREAPDRVPHWRQVIDDAAKRIAEEERKRQQNRSRQRSEEILSAAVRVFARQGIAKTRIADVAAEAGIPAPSLYGYYNDKEELAYAIPIKRQLQFFAEYALQSEKMSTAREQLAHFLWLTTDFARRDPDWAAVLYLEVWPSVLIKEARVRDVIDDYARILIGLIQEGEERGEWEDPNPYETAAIFTGSISQLIITWLLYRKPRDLTRASRAMVERLFQLLKVPTEQASTSRGAKRAPRAAANLIARGTLAAVPTERARRRTKS